MIRAIAGRVGGTIATLLGALALLFALTTLVPGNPADSLLGPQATPEYAARFVAEMGLDRPAPERFGKFLVHAARGDLGTDPVSGRPVLGLVLGAVPSTMALALAGMLAAIVIGVPAGVLAAVRPGGLLDWLVGSVSIGVMALPNFVVAIGLLVVFSSGVKWLPVLGSGATGLILPAAALALGWIGYLARLARASMLEVLGEPWLRTSVAYGVGTRRVMFRQALRPALGPLVAVLGVGTGRLLGGAVLVEVVFARAGLGKLAFDAIGSRNYPVLQGAVLAIVFFYAVANLAADLLLVSLDPRLRA